GRDVCVARHYVLCLDFLGGRRGPLEHVYCFTDHAYVHIEAHTRDGAGLFGTEDVSCTADLQVLHRHVHPGTGLGVLGDRGQPFMGGFGEWLLRWVQEVGVGAFASPTDPAAQLVQLGQAVGVGAVDDEGVGVGHVQTGLDDGGGDQYVVVLLPEVDHDPLELLLVH